MSLPEIQHHKRKKEEDEGHAYTHKYTNYWWLIRSLQNDVIFTHAFWSIGVKTAALLPRLVLYEIICINHWWSNSVKCSSSNTTLLLSLRSVIPLALHCALCLTFHCGLHVATTPVEHNQEFERTTTTTRRWWCYKKSLGYVALTSRSIQWRLFTHHVDDYGFEMMAKTIRGSS